MQTGMKQRMFMVKVGELYCMAGHGYCRVGKNYGPKLSKKGKVWVGVGPFKNYLRSVTLPDNAELIELEVTEVVIDSKEFNGYV